MKPGGGIPEHSTYLSPPFQGFVGVGGPDEEEALFCYLFIQARKSTMIYGGNYNHCYNP